MPLHDVRTTAREGMKDAVTRMTIEEQSAHVQRLQEEVQSLRTFVCHAPLCGATNSQFRWSWRKAHKDSCTCGLSKLMEKG